jgi:hypothetical protein
MTVFAIYDRFTKLLTSNRLTILQHKIRRVIPSQPVFVLALKCCVINRESTYTNFIVFVAKDINTDKHAHAVTSNKQSSVLKRHLLPVLL